ncbi:MAG: GNAT family N-acetyltransferase [Deltaproteobacteria bacterium]|nr:GNAT family N-acetyltransferase [Deltaproteobacteria bacterium]
MRVRAAYVTDAPAIARVQVESWRTTYAGIVPADYLANLSYEQQGQFWEHVASTVCGPAALYVAEGASGEITGFASSGTERTGHPLYTGELYAIYLLADCQRHGVGRQLFQAVVDGLLQHGLSTMLVWVLADNPARAFYETLGGQYVTEQEIMIGNAQLKEVAYGWRDIHGLGSQPPMLC